MELYFHQVRETFHLMNDKISYMMKVLSNGMLAQMYFGKGIADRPLFDYLLEVAPRLLTACVALGYYNFLLEHCRQEYPSYGTSDFRQPAIRIAQPNGSALTEFTYVSHRVTKGKPPLTGLPATYCEDEEEALTLMIELIDAPTQAVLELSYTIFHDEPALSRSARIPSPVPHPTGAWCLARPSPTDFTQPLVGYRFRVYRGQSAQDRAHRAVYRREIVRT